MLQLISRLVNNPGYMMTPLSVSTRYNVAIAAASHVGSRPQRALKRWWLSVIPRSHNRLGFFSFVHKQRCLHRLPLVFLFYFWADVFWVSVFYQYGLKMYDNDISWDPNCLLRVFLPFSISNPLARFGRFTGKSHCHFLRFISSPPATNITLVAGSSSQASSLRPSASPPCLGDSTARQSPDVHRHHGLLRPSATPLQQQSDATIGSYCRLRYWLFLSHGLCLRDLMLSLLNVALLLDLSPFIESTNLVESSQRTSTLPLFWHQRTTLTTLYRIPAINTPKVFDHWPYQLLDPPLVTSTKEPIRHGMIFADTLGGFDPSPSKIDLVLWWLTACGFLGWSNMARIG